MSICDLSQVFSLIIRTRALIQYYTLFSGLEIEEYYNNTEYNIR